MNSKVPVKESNDWYGRA